jgi:superoxide dismutase, Cu-Zn family
MSRRLTCAVVCAVAAWALNLLAATPAVATGVAPSAELYGSGKLAAPNPTSTAVTYNPALAPIGATVTGVITSSANSTMAELVVSGLLPNRGYAVHTHTNACGATGEAAGPHYQNRIDPAATPQAPSTNPEYANPSNEIWLDVRTDATGSGRSHTTVPFIFTDRAPGSIVVHEAMATATHPGHAGQAGGRLACLTLSRR